MRMTDRRKRQLIFFGLLVSGLVLTIIPWDVVVQWGILNLFGPRESLPEWVTELIEIFRTVMKGLGEALAIAAILAAVVDEAAKRDLLKEFTENISAHIAGRLLPRQMREHIEQYLNDPLVRTKWEIIYILDDVPGHPDFKRLVTKSTYEVENRSSSAREYHCTYDLEASLFPNVGRTSITKMSGFNLLENKPVFAFPDRDQPDWKPTESDGCLRLRKSVSIPAEGKPAFRFELGSEAFLPDGFIIPFFAGRPVLSTTLEVKYRLDQLNVYVEPPVGDKIEPTDVEGGKKWVFTKPMLPGQGFTVRFVTIAGLEATRSASTAAARPAE
jgi:hypothetical protein